MEIFGSGRIRRAEASKRFATAGQLPTVRDRHCFSTNANSTNGRRELSTSSYNRSTSGAKYSIGSNRQQFYKRWKIIKETSTLMYRNKTENLLKQFSDKNNQTLSRNNYFQPSEGSLKEIRVNFHESVGNFSKWRGIDSKFTMNLMKPFASPLIRKVRKIDVQTMEHKTTSHISKADSMEELNKLEQEKKIYNAILELQRQNHDENLPYKLINSFNLAAVKTHYDKIAGQKKMDDAAITIQSVFRGCKARKKFRKLKTSKLKLAVNIQKVWRKHFQRIRNRREREALFRK